MRFEYKNEIENAYKFWEIKVVNTKVITKYGRIGINQMAANGDAAQIF